MKKQFLLILIIFCEISLNFSFAQGVDVAHKSRREELSKSIDTAVIVIPAEIKKYSTHKENKNFYYLTGLKIPNAVLILTPDLDDKDLLITDSERLDVEVLKTYKIVKKENVSKTIYELSNKYNVIATQFTGFEALEESKIDIDIFDYIIKLDFILSDMRMIKENQEIRNLRTAINITADALNEVFKYTEPGFTEKALRSVIRYQFESNDTKEAFIQVASGPNSTNIHFGATERILKENDLIVFDVGTYYNNYTSDISRTIPANGKFTSAQSEIYKVVLEAQEKGIQLTLPGNNHTDVQEAITKVLIDGLFNLNLITDKDSEWQRKLFIKHGWSHFIGLDVHDVIKYAAKKKDKTYKEGMVLTVEPGLYFPENYLDKIPRSIKGLVSEEAFEKYKAKVLPVYNKYVNIGVRIEDDVLVTFDGFIVLSSRVPKKIRDIEDMMKEESFFNYK